MDEVVFDGVAGADHHAVFETGQRVDERFLHVARQAHREAVDVDLWNVEAFGLEEDLMRLLVGESHDLVFERWTVSRSNARNLSVVERGLADIRPDQVADAVVRIEDVAADLLAIDPPGHERERHRRLIAGFRREAREVDAVAVQARRRAGLQASPLQAERLERFREHVRRRLSGALPRSAARGRRGSGR